VPTRLHAISLGPALALHEPQRGAVHSIFAHAVNVIAGAEMWTLLARDRGDLPFGVRVDADRLDAFGLRAGDEVAVRAGVLAAADIVLDCRNAPRWSVGVPRDIAPGLASRLDEVAHTAATRAWAGSAPAAQSVVDALLRTPQPPDHAAEAALDCVLGAVVGLGPGLTPSGDDVLVGILAVLALPQAASAPPLQLPDLAARTTTISAHLLRQAARGHVPRAVAQLLLALLRGDEGPSLDAALARVLATGATSGADACMGIVTAARAFLLRHLHGETA
jgi:hypothetical protein